MFWWRWYVVGNTNVVFTWRWHVVWDAQVTFSREGDDICTEMTCHARSRQYKVQLMTCSNCADDIITRWRWHALMTCRRSHAMPWMRWHDGDDKLQITPWSWHDGDDVRWRAWDNMMEMMTCFRWHAGVDMMVMTCNYIPDMTWWR